MKEIKGISNEGGSLEYAFVVKVQSNRIKEIVRAYKQLQQHPLVRHLEFIPESCYPRNSLTLLSNQPHEISITATNSYIHRNGL